ncbi:MAG: hypothetical protein GF333_05365 [Candidatus Omnitrophica bacterium]|nr:hypothetical protein [Candidatus Omnitrophota bacterium]
MKRVMQITGVLAIFMLLFSSDGSAQVSESFNVEATIPRQNSFNVTITRVEGNTTNTTNAVDFGRLTFDPQLNIFTADAYYFVDIGVGTNTPQWSLEHAVTPVQRAGGEDTLDDHINVVFVKQLSDIASEQLSKVSYANSDEHTYTRDQLSGGWLRVFYGIGTGDDQDAPGVSPVTVEKPSGDYVGEVTITLFSTQ